LADTLSTVDLLEDQGRTVSDPADARTALAKTDMSMSWTPQAVTSAPAML
jgi:hypothetical protein